MSGGDKLDPRWMDGVVGGAAEQEEEEASLVWCVKWPCDQGVDLNENERKKIEVSRQRRWINGYMGRERDAGR